MEEEEAMREETLRTEGRGTERMKVEGKPGEEGGGQKRQALEKWREKAGCQVGGGDILGEEEEPRFRAERQRQIGVCGHEMVREI